MPISTNDKHNIGDLLSSRNPFKIPKHQRAYSWTEDDVISFCTDVLRLSNQPNTQEYFFGGIVSIHQLANNAPGRTFTVVDGQQRLTTFTLFLGQLRNAYNCLSYEAKGQNNQALEQSLVARKANIENSYLTYTELRNNPPSQEFRLTLSNIDNSFFKNLLSSNRNLNQTNPYSAISHKKLDEAWDAIYETVIKPILDDNTLTLNQKVDKLIKIEDAFLENCVVIHIVCDTLSEAYQLFEVLNDRGRDLATGDYLRSNTLELLERFPQHQFDVVQYWDDILSDDSSNDFFKAYLIANKGNVSIGRSKQLHSVIRNEFFNYDEVNVTQSDAGTIRQIIYNMNELIEIYNKIKKGFWPYSNSQIIQWDQNRLKLLTNTLEHTLSIPLLLAIYNKGTEQMFNQVVQILEKAVFRYITVASRRANKLSEIYSKHIRLLNTVPQSFNLQDFLNDISSLVSTNVPESMFRDLMLTELKYANNKKAKNKIRYFLTSVEHYFQWYRRGNMAIPPTPDKTKNFNLDAIEIEHIYPQNAQVINQNLEQVKNEIGNLVFWGSFDNKSASNDIFVNKKTLYQQSSILITNNISNYQQWDIQTFSHNLNFYQDIAAKIFSI